MAAVEQVLPCVVNIATKSVVPVSDRLWQVYNYSSPLEGDEDPTWFTGQHGPTRIYRATVDWGD